MAKPPPFLELRNVTKIYESQKGDVVTALKNLQFVVAENEFISLLGPSGCGKTTLVKLLTGLLQPTKGEILEHGKRRTTISQDHAVVFQQYSLLPWLNVQKNIEFGMMLRRVPEEERAKTSMRYMEAMGLKAFKKSYPRELSGGMQQRVALARALATNPKVLFMDEPFAALDVQTKRFMQDLLLQIWEREKRTIIFITHDVEEAVFMSDTLYLMSARPGKIARKINVRLARPRDLKTEFSEEFVTLKRRVQEIITKEALAHSDLKLEIYKNL